MGNLTLERGTNEISQVEGAKVITNGVAGN